MSREHLTRTPEKSRQQFGNSGFGQHCGPEMNTLDYSNSPQNFPSISTEKSQTQPWSGPKFNSFSDQEEHKGDGKLRDEDFQRQRQLLDADETKASYSNTFSGKEHISSNLDGRIQWSKDCTDRELWAGVNNQQHHRKGFHFSMRPQTSDQQREERSLSQYKYSGSNAGSDQLPLASKKGLPRNFFNHSDENQDRNRSNSPYLDNVSGRRSIDNRSNPFRSFPGQNRR